MSDHDWRERQRGWEAAPEDQEALAAYIAALRWAGRPVPGDLLERRVFPARRFESRCKATVHVHVSSAAGEELRVGTTPGEDGSGVDVPSHRSWWVRFFQTPERDLGMLLEDLEGQPHPGLEIVDPSENVRDDALRLVSRCSPLARLELVNCKAITGAGLESLRGLRDLEALRVRWGPTSVPPGSWAFVQALDRLTRLDITACGLMDDGVLRTLTDLPSLTDVTLVHAEFNSFFGSDGLASLAQCPSLRSVHLARVLLSDAALLALGTSRSLCSLRLSGQASITAAGLRALGGAPRLNELELPYLSPGLDARDLAPLVELPLRELGLEGGVPDAGLKHVPVSVRSLTLTSPQITDAGLRVLESLSALERLTLRCRNATDAGLSALRTLKNLHTLNLLSDARRSRFSDRALELVAQCRALEELLVSNADGCTTVGFERLAQAPRLRSLRLSSCLGVTDQTLAALARMGSLRSLELSSCDSISDAGVRHLAALVGLEKLAIDFCDGVSAGVVQELEDALPGCRVSASGLRQ